MFGSRISLRAERLTYAVGFVVLMAFILWVTGFDIARLGEPDLAMSRSAVGDDRTVDVGGVKVGSAHPVVVQSMTNTDTADADGTAIQVARLAHAGSELVRVTVNNDPAAAAVPGDAPQAARPRRRRARHRRLPLQRPPAPGRVPGDGEGGLAKYRINPGNVGAKRHDENFQTIVRVAIENDKPVRIGVNWGSLDQALLTDLMNANATLAEPRDSRDVMIEAMVESAMRSAELAEATGLGHDRIILSAKVSNVRDVVDVVPDPRRRGPTTRSTSA